PDRNTYRLVYGESDLLPGLVIDRYGDYLAIQTLSAGMERLQPLVVESLVEMLNPRGIHLRNDSPVRSLEGLPLEKKTVHGHVPEAVQIALGTLKFLVDVPNGQKTGFFLDQEANRDLMARFVRNGARVLDLFCYTGAWGLHALAAGASRAVGVDSSRAALKLAQENALLNGIGDRFETVRDSALDFLKKTHQPWDVIVLDPPAFIKSRAQLKEGRGAYIDLNRRALGKLRPEGILVTCSCSHHINLSDFEEILMTATVQSGRRVSVLDVRSQGPDHPVLLPMPETRYLKVLVCMVL
ncbi:MAG: class I SAM-dependent rRNA methyltransferase, partial [Desulfomonile sp.]|nr:class I SAM-dependent rRNA methyltransferase [Desulfomonile sp.]